MKDEKTKVVNEEQIILNQQLSSYKSKINEILDLNDHDVTAGILNDEIDAAFINGWSLCNTYMKEVLKYALHQMKDEIRKEVISEQESESQNLKNNIMNATEVYKGYLQPLDIDNIPFPEHTIRYEIFKNALMGIDVNDRVIYCYDWCVEILMDRDDLSMEDAECIMENVYVHKKYNENEREPIFLKLL